MREDWIEVELGKILKVSSGKGLTSKAMSGAGFPVYGGNGITGYHKEFLFQDPKLIIGRVGVRCGVTHITKPSSWITDNALIVNFKFQNLDLKFMQVKLQFENLNKLSNSTAQPVISGSKIYDYRINLPPLPEQRAIVAKIEQLFSELDNGIANFKTAQEQLKVYRQAVLKKAFEGEYDRWQLKELCAITGGVTKGRKLEGKETIELPYLRVANVQDGFLNLDVIKEVTVLPTDLEKYRLEYEDVLFTEGGDRDKLGRGTVWKNEIEDCIHQNHIFRARVMDRAVLNPYFLSYYAQSPEGKDYFYKNGKHTTNLASINKTILSNLPIPLPTVFEQEMILQEIESRLSVCDKIEESITESLTKAEALRQSILKKAFEGKLLTEAELAACRKEPDWEPAEKLLERMKGSKLLNKVQ